jgi:YcxB-like protein
MSPSLRFDVSFADFRFLQGYMGRRLYAKNKGLHARALMSVILCALFIVSAMVLNIYPALALALFRMGYPLSLFVGVIVCLIAAITSLIPAIRLRLAFPRMQVSDDGPLLGPTSIILEDDGLIFDRTLVRSKYLWPAFKGVEMAKGALILIIDNGIGLIIPAAAFASEGDRYEFAAALQRRLEITRASNVSG